MEVPECVVCLAESLRCIDAGWKDDWSLEEGGACARWWWLMDVLSESVERAEEVRKAAIGSWSLLLCLEGGSAWLVAGANGR